MTIETGDSVQKFGTQVEVTNGSVVVVAGAFTDIADIIPFANTDDALEAHMVLLGTLDGALSESGAIGIYGRRTDVQLTNDETIPSLDSPYELLNSFPMGVGAASQNRTARVELNGAYSGQIWEFYFKNETPENITLRVWITPVTVGPSA